MSANVYDGEIQDSTTGDGLATEEKEPSLPQAEVSTTGGVLAMEGEAPSLPQAEVSTTGGVLAMEGEKPLSAVGDDGRIVQAQFTITGDIVAKRQDPFSVFAFTKFDPWASGNPLPDVTHFAWRFFKDDPKKVEGLIAFSGRHKVKTVKSKFLLPERYYVPNCRGYDKKLIRWFGSTNNYSDIHCDILSLRKDQFNEKWRSTAFNNYRKIGTINGVFEVDPLSIKNRKNSELAKYCLDCKVANLPFDPETKCCMHLECK
jgi:hypothetical protein